MEQTGRSRQALYWKLIVTIGILALTALLWKYRGELTAPGTRIPVEWSYSDEKGEKAISLFPCTVPGQAGKTYCFYAELPENLADDAQLVFYRHAQQAAVEIDGSLIYDSGNQEAYPEDAWGEYVYVTLGKAQRGKKLSIIFSNLYPSLSAQMQDIYIGSSQTVVAGLWKKMSARTVLSILMFIAGALSIVLNHIYYQSSEESLAMRYMGWFILTLSVWCLLQTRFLHFLGLCPFGLLLAEHLALLIFPLPIVLAFRLLTFSENFGREYEGFAAVYGLFLLAAVLLDLFGAVSLVKTAAWSLLFFGVFIVYIGVFGYFEVQASTSFDHTHSTLHSSLLLNLKESVALSICMVGCSVSGTWLYRLFIYAAYVLVILLFGEIYTEIKALGRIKEELEQSRMTLLLSQIKPHFLYNTLNSIRTLIRTNVEEADRLVYFFSRFLRSNMLLINNKDRIPFSNELNHIKSYVKIEETCFPKLKVEYDIKSTHFSVPALSIQPLVENAIKHGVLKQVEGGTVWVRTDENDKYIFIEILDNGVGFETEEALAKTDGMGLKNIENRLKYYCGAKLKIESAPGRGTAVYVKIPKNRGGRKKREDTDDISG